MISFFRNLLNEVQLQVLQYVEKCQKLLAIEGVPGCGKTRTLVHLLMYLIISKLFKMEEIVAITFTKKAAAEMKERAIHLLQKYDPNTYTDRDLNQQLTIKTFHSFGYQMLKEYKIVDNKTTIFDEKASEITLHQVMLKERKNKRLEFDPNPDTVEKFRQFISDLKNDCRDVESYENDSELQVKYKLNNVYRAYQEELKKNNALDFDDLQLLFYKELESNEEFRNAIQARFKFVLVDEFQDTNTLQIHLLELIIGEKNYLYVFGDADQAIYEWRRANPAFLVYFHENFKGAKKHYINLNYRNPATIVQKAYSLILNNAKRSDKQIKAKRPQHDEQAEKVQESTIEVFMSEKPDHEAKKTVAWVQSLIHSGLYKKGDIAFLARTHKAMHRVQMELNARKIDYVTANGHTFYKDEHVRSLLGYIKLLYNPKDDSACFEAIRYPPRGVKEKRFRKLKDAAETQELTVFELLEKLIREQDSNCLPDDWENPYALEEEPKKRKTKKKKASSEDATMSLFGDISEVKDTALTFADLDIPQDAVKHLKTFMRFMMDIPKFGHIQELIRYVWENSGYKHWVDARIAKTKSFDSKRICERIRSNVEELLDRIETFEKDKIEHDQEYVSLAVSEKIGIFLEDVVLSQDSDDIGQIDAVKLLTIHASKGLEFPVVIMLAMEEDRFPDFRSVDDDDKIQEERRLCYVGLTRAQSLIRFSYVRDRYEDKKVKAPSRFLRELNIDSFPYL